MSAYPQHPAGVPVNTLDPALWEQVKDVDVFRGPFWTNLLENGLNVYNEDGSLDRNRREAVAELLSKNCHWCIERLTKLEKRLLDEFVGANKREIIRMVIVSAIAHQPMLLVGVPGTAKSAILRRFSEGLGMRRVREDRERTTFFEYLLHGFTEPDEVFGPVDVRALQAEPPVFQRLHKGSIVDADLIFLDEIFRANSAILNSLLTVMNERQVYEGGKAVRARARLVYGASNSTPNTRQMEELRAFYERFLVRMESRLVEKQFAPRGGRMTEENHDLIEKGWPSVLRDLRASHVPEKSALPPVACMNDLILLHRGAGELWGGDDLGELREFIDKHFFPLVAKLHNARPQICMIDDRKFLRLLLLARAHALYVHNGPPLRNDLAVFYHIWQDLDASAGLQEQVRDYLAASS